MTLKFLFQVLVIGTNEDEEAYFTSRLEAENVKTLPKKVTTEYSIPGKADFYYSTCQSLDFNSLIDRQKLYLDGGVLFVTTRIMVVDMLTDRMPLGNSFEILYMSCFIRKL